LPLRVAIVICLLTRSRSHSLIYSSSSFLSLFFLTDPATPDIYTLSLHDALPIYGPDGELVVAIAVCYCGSLDEGERVLRPLPLVDRKSTRLNSSHQIISYAVFCLKKKKNKYEADTII